jgi:anti-sigma factor RsiW
MDSEVGALGRGFDGFGEASTQLGMEHLWRKWTTSGPAAEAHEAKVVETEKVGGALGSSCWY